MEVISKKPMAVCHSHQGDEEVYLSGVSFLPEEREVRGNRWSSHAIRI